MKGLLKCLLYVPLFVVVFIGSFLSLSNTANAYSVTTMPTIQFLADNINTYVGGGRQYGSFPACDTKTITVGQLTSPSDNGNTYSYQNAYSYNGSTDNFITAYNSAVDSTTGYGIMENDYNGTVGDPQTLTLFYFDSATNFTFSNDGTYMMADHSIHMLTVGLNYNAGCRYQLTPNNAGNNLDGNYNIYLPNSTFALLKTDHISYPDGYTGPVIPSSQIVQAKVRPSYTYTVSKTGLMEVKYNNNVTPFLTGITTLNLDKMTDNWAGLDSSFSKIDQANPAGWLDLSEQLPGPGYYIMRFTHNQQLDSPPWPATPNTHIDEADVEFHWNGSEVLNGTTDCADGGICVTNGPTNTNGVFGGGIDIFGSGLTQAVIAPITALQTLTTASCSPIVFPFGPTASFTVPCLSQYYSNVPALFNIWQVFITGGVMYLVIIKLMGRIRAYTNPLDDSIDVVQL